MAKQLTLLDKNNDSLNVNSINGNTSILKTISGYGSNIKFIKINNIKISETFKNLFAIDTNVLHTITENMREKGFDNAIPIIIWKEENILIDGHTRVMAAKEVGIEEVPAVYASFPDENAVLDYMHQIQFGRRNITDADLIQLIINALPFYEKKYGNGSKAEFLSKRFFGLSESKAKQAVIVAEKGNEKDITKIKEGISTIYQIYTKLKKDKSTPKEKVSTNFFDDFDEEVQVIKSDDNGAFYFRDLKKQKVVKAFSLPKYLNTPILRKRIEEVIEETIQ